MTAYDFEGNDWDDITESEKRNIVDRLVRERDALSDDYETLVAEHDLCAAPTPPAEGLDRRLSDCEDALSTVEAAYDALAATPPAEGLDEERLTSAMAAHARGHEDGRMSVPCSTDIAREYAALPADTALDKPWSDANGDEVERGAPDET